MERGNLDKWTIKGCENLLFFSQLVNELLSDYSIPSNRIPTLNSHYLCKDAMDTIKGIEYRGLDKEALQPVMEELCSELGKDLVFQGNNRPRDYFVKYQNDQYSFCDKISDFGYEDLKNIVNALSQMFFNNNDYYFQLRDQIAKIIKENKPEKQGTLFRLTKSMVTELKNAGYSSRYMRMVMNQLFWEPSTIVDSPNKIDDFFERFKFEKKRYTVVFKVDKQKIKSMIDCSMLDNISFKYTDDLLGELKEKVDENFYGREEYETFLVAGWKALDPFAAADGIIYIIETFAASIYRFYDHTYEYHIGAEVPCKVFDDVRAYDVEKEIQAVEHVNSPSTKQVSEGTTVVNGIIEQLIQGNYGHYPLIRAMQNHTRALNSLSEENQLLDLWAIFESVLINNKDVSNRIKHICKYLVPVLKQKYIYSLFKQLADDIKNYDENLYVNIVGEKTDESEIVLAICKFTLLNDKKSERDAVLAKCDDFPLLKERINYYNDKLNTPEKVHSFVKKHAKRVEWQIKRIYRNRNMIVHNGEKTPYLSLLVENLHSYVDDFLLYVIHSMAEGKNINSMCQELFVKESKWDSEFLQKGTKEKTKVKDPITAEQIRDVISM